MTEFFSISIFRADLASLLKVRRNVYGGIADEIEKEFSGRSISEIRQNRDMILMEEDSILIKLRLPDKKQRLSKKDGYRLLYLVSKEKDIVTFLSVYPKNGPSQKLSVSIEELKHILEVFVAESIAGEILPYSLSARTGD